ncbi:MAG TPA: cytochrome b/b6 domain-containing protein [Thermodesulfobacteriota bacterium]|nr:cytochrome b/b6 domain-containing protein [Thermodesulfobacteriota bacterium]
MTSELFSLPAFTMADYNPYRVDDRILFAFVAAALVFCVIHAARRAFRQPQPTDLPREKDTLSALKAEEMERHSLFQRIYHWSNAAAVLTLSFSGWMIYQPRQAPTLEQTASEWFFWHRWGVAVLLAGVLAHTINESFMAQGANPMAMNRAEARRILAIFRNFFGLSKSYPLAGKYHTGQIFFHWAVAGNLFLLILTGMVLWKPLRDLLPLSLLGLGWDFIFFSRLLHGFFSATLTASLIGHLYFALFIKKNWPEAKSIVTGRISCREYLESHSPLE